MKRLLDVVISGLAIILLSPLLILVTVAVRWKLGSPIFFKQQRPGLHAKPFTLIKFRTMLDGDAPDSERLTKFGKRLRASSLDELPELWNIFVGDMSLVGPRPLLMEYLPLYTKEQFRRHDTRPGLTGWAQINGRNAISWDEKFALDLWYISNRSLWLDIKILSLTAFAMWRGINAHGEATMSKFEG